MNGDNQTKRPFVITKLELDGLTVRSPSGNQYMLANQYVLAVDSNFLAIYAYQAGAFVPIMRFDDSEETREMFQLHAMSQ